ncbi:ABC transporter permease [Methyloraptor flagellatus]|uniref:ABC transporter permease n=1 Tax=Methyloraptor flagellatus TaxID=3162530 RepID=A0AAU7XDD5_9HYPH
MTASAVRTARLASLGVDKLGVVVAALIAIGAGSPFVVFRANRIVAGEARAFHEALPLPLAAALVAVVLGAALIALFRTPERLRLVAAIVMALALAFLVGAAADHLTPPGNRYARVAPASGFWVLTFATTILFADSVVRLRLGPLARILALTIGAAVFALVLWSGIWNGLSILKEYATRSDVFWREAGAHMMLALGSLAAAVVVGLPLGIVIERKASLRAPVLNTLNAVQTIPSIALFGILIGPLGWLAAHVPGAAALGIRGIGMAPAFIALFLYSLLPMVANTVVGLTQVPRDAVEAARGMGMTDRQRLVSVELPLALPVILTGVRIVLVQNIGLATIAALIGGGGFGVFVFLGIGQTAPDLILLGAVPTVLLAFAAAVVLDAAVDLVTGARP